MPKYPFVETKMIRTHAKEYFRFRCDVPGPINILTYFSRLTRHRIELLSEGGNQVVASVNTPEGWQRSLLWLDYTAPAGGLWLVRIENLSGPDGECQVTVRYPTVAGNPGKVDHIVVLMMENRSFDQMLGYLSLQGHPEVDGIRGDDENRYSEHFGIHYRPRHLTDTTYADDPAHTGSAVDEQLDGGSMRGFVKSFYKTLPEVERAGDVMGYYDGRQLPTYDFLARNYLICDRWHCSVPGSTWPNRLYALAGTSQGLRNNPELSFKNPPGFELTTIFHHLQRHGIAWRYYYSDVPFLLLFKGVAQDRTYTRWIRHIKAFFNDVWAAKLPTVSWIDPNFSDFPIGEPANDDHPPADIARGQWFVGEVYNALRQSPTWSRTLLIIIYDEHGGFYDHVSPDSHQYDPEVGRYGVRVPAILVSPWVIRGRPNEISVDHTIFDHTSILRTILLRYWPHDGLPDMGPRVAHANDLWPLLGSAQPHFDIGPVASPLPQRKPRSRRVHMNEFGKLVRRGVFGL